MADTNNRIAGLTLGAATVVTGMIAGVYYSFCCAVMPGLARTDDRTFIQTMQRINVAIVNPAFLMSFFGALALPAAAAVLQRRLGPRSATRWITAATVLYALTLATTVSVNIPLNNALDRAGDPNRIPDPAAVRQGFEGTWNTWNLVRAALSTAAFVCLSRAMILHGRDTGNSL